MAITISILLRKDGDPLSYHCETTVFFSFLKKRTVYPLSESRASTINHRILFAAQVERLVVLIRNALQLFQI